MTTTIIELGGDSVCVIKTKKSGRDIACVATEHVREGDFLVHRCILVGGDCSTNMARVELAKETGARATKAALARVHAAGLEYAEAAATLMRDRIAEHGIPGN